MRTVLINQARMTSTRLPGKVLLEVQGRSLLEIQLERLRRIAGVDQVIVATTTNETDDPIVALCQRLGVAVWRGSETDVLARFEGAARHAAADWVVRVTSDCPLIDPEVVGQIIREAQDPAKACDYASNTLTRSYPRGLDAECFTASALYAAATEAVDPAEREHVTPFIYWRPQRFNVRQVVHASDLSAHRWTVDTPEDFELIRRLLDRLLVECPHFGLQDCLDLLAQHPDWAGINAEIQQKETQS